MRRQEERARREAERAQEEEVLRGVTRRKRALNHAANLPGFIRGSIDADVLQVNTLFPACFRPL